ncbi:MAG: hypothetical protein AAB971_03705 [Patescibacteria group bacterium]
MLVLLHIMIAVGSVLYATLLLLKPSVKSFGLAYGLVGLTLLSGSYLVWLEPAYMVSACASGLLYLGIVSVLIAAARHRRANRVSLI